MCKSATARPSQSSVRYRPWLSSFSFPLFLFPLLALRQKIFIRADDSDAKPIFAPYAISARTRYLHTAHLPARICEAPRTIQTRGFGSYIVVLVCTYPQCHNTMWKTNITNIRHIFPNIFLHAFSRHLRKGDHTHAARQPAMCNRQCNSK